MKNTYRFFVPAEAIQGETLAVAERELLHQWNNVLRLRVGQHIALLDGLGMGYIAELTSLNKREAQGRILQRYAANGEPSINVTLYLALTRGERFEIALQKCTELGATAFVPLLCERSQADVSATKRERWQRIIREAAEQAGRGRLPRLYEAQTVAQALPQARGHLLLAETGQTLAFKAALALEPRQALAIWSGPEGGWSDNELEAAYQAGLICVSLGSRILRAETAPIAALAAVMFQFDQWFSPNSC